MTDNRLKSLADRINRLMDERDAIGADIRDIYTEAKGVGYIPKALRKVIARLRMDPAKRAEDDTLVELYEAALGPVGKAMAAVRDGATLDDAAEANGVHRATLARARAVAKTGENATVANHPENATAIPEPRTTHPMQANPAPQGSPPSAPEAGEVVSLAGPPVPEGGVGTGTHSSTDTGIPVSGDEAPATPSVGAVAAEPRVAPPEDDLAIPPFLIRRRAEAGA